MTDDELKVIEVRTNDDDWPWYMREAQEDARALIAEVRRLRTIYIAADKVVKTADEFGLHGSAFLELEKALDDYTKAVAEGK